MKHLPEIQVAAGIIWREGRFLASKRPKRLSGAGFWEFPGGKREPGETMEQTLVRELAEELGIAAQSPLMWKTLRHSYPDVLVELHFMHIVRFSGEPAAREGQELRWVTPAEARLLPFLPADAPVLKMLHPPAQSPSLERS